jgi:ketosteroid isomerase-like protein
MSQENVEIVRQLFEYGPEVQTFLRQDRDLSGHPWLLLWHPDCVLEELAEVPDAAAYHGRAGVMRYFQQAGDAWEDMTYTPAELLDGSAAVLSATDIWARSKAGVETQMRVYQLFRLRDGMIVYVTGYTDRQRAFEAAGLSEQDAHADP